MKIKQSVKIGGKVMTVSADELGDLKGMHEAIVLTHPKRKCDVCGDIGYDNKYFVSNKAKSEKGEFYYVNVKCKCGAKSKLSMQKGGGYYWNAYEVYKPKK